MVAHASPFAANPFESVLRAILIEADIPVVPQWATTIGGVTYHPDLADPIRGIAIEADSFAHHAGKDDHDQDCVRYNALVTGGWIVLRFTWDQVMFSAWRGGVDGPRRACPAAGGLRGHFCSTPARSCGVSTSAYGVLRARRWEVAPAQSSPRRTRHSAGVIGVR